MPSNPYTPGQVPRILAGRTAEMRRIEGLLARVATYGELGGPLLVFHAPRGIGKTSLLRAGQRRPVALVVRIPLDDEARHATRTSDVRVGSVIALPLQGRVRVLRVLHLPARRGPAAEARDAYEEIADNVSQQAGAD